MKVELHWNGEYGGGEKEIKYIQDEQLEDFGLTKSDVGTSDFDDFMQHFIGTELYNFDYKIIPEKKKRKVKVYKPVKRKPTSYKPLKKKSAKRSPSKTTRIRTFESGYKGKVVAVSKTGLYKLASSKKGPWKLISKAKANDVLFSKYKVLEKVKYPKYTLYIF